MAESRVTDAPAGLDEKELAKGIGKVVAAKHYSRIVKGGRTLCYCNKGYLDFRVQDIEGAPSKAPLVLKGDRAHLARDSENLEAARELLAFVAGRKNGGN